MRTYGIDINLLTRENRTGVERYVFELVSAMMQMPLKEDERVVLYGSELPSDLPELPEGWYFKRLKWPFKGWTHIRLSFSLLINPPTVFFSPGHEIPFLHRKAKMVTTIHDIASMMQLGLYAESEQGRQKWAVTRALRQASLLFTPSQATKEDLIKKTPDLLAGKSHHSPELVVTPLAAVPRPAITKTRQKALLKELGLKENQYLLYAGRIEEKKNVEFLAQAFLDGEFEKLKLVLVGKQGFEGHKVEALANLHSDQILMPGFVTDEQLTALYGGALAFTFPSHYEGFGMPVLEAMQRGTPVIASDIACLKEVGGEAAVYCSPTEPKSWILAVRSLLMNDAFRDELVAAGKARSQEFSWEICADKTWEGLRKV